MISKLQFISLKFNYLLPENISVSKYKCIYKHKYKDKKYPWHSLSVGSHNSDKNHMANT